MISPSAVAQPTWADELKEPPRLSAVLVIGDHDTNNSALRPLLENEKCVVRTVAPADEPLEILRRSAIDLVVLEITREDGGGIDLCRSVRALRRADLTPILVVASDHTPEREIAFMESGADCVLGWPFAKEVFSARVRSMLRRKAFVDRLEDSESILTSLSHAVEQRDNITGGHCDRIAALCVAIGMEMGLPDEQLLALHSGGYLHDIGKIGIPDSILLKPGPLDDDEWRIMRSHTTKGEQICRPLRCVMRVLPIIRSHHERWDGSGYPDGLKGRDIPLLARVLQIADIYDALTSPRCYKPAMPPAEAIGVMQDETDRGWRDPELMGLFLRFKPDDICGATQTRAIEWRKLRAMTDSLDNLSRALNPS